MESLVSGQWLIGCELSSLIGAQAFLSLRRSESDATARTNDC